jgi:signal transduction histidine kinase
LFGSVVLAAAGIHDLGLGMGSIQSIPLFAFGFVAFTYGVALTLVSRYTRVATDLEVSTEALQHQSIELGQAYAELRRTQAELIQSKQLAVIGELAAVIAHEVRNPLAIVGNAVASLRKRQTNRDDRSMLLGIITEEMSRLDELVGRLIHYARPVVLDRQATSVANVLQRSAKVVEAAGGGVVIEERMEVSNIEIDPKLMRQAFENIFTNALQAGATEDIRVSISRRNVGGQSVLAVAIADNGEGMTAEQLDAALTPFFTTRPTGTGLGLPIVLRIIDAHGGQVQIDSERERGTTVTLLLPTDAGERLSAVLDAGPISLFP